MGYWSGLALFNHKKFIDLIVPAFKEGESNSIVKDGIEILNKRRGTKEKRNFIGLENIMDFYNDNLNETILTIPFAVHNGTLVSEREYFNFNSNKHGNCWNYEDLMELFEIVVSLHCIHSIKNFGLAFNPQYYLYTQNIDLAIIVEKLCRGSLLWAAGTGGYGEGISGWIDEEKVDVLHKGIDGIFFNSDYFNSDPQYNSYYEKTAYLKNVIYKAATCNCGLLWGRDLKLLHHISWKKLNIDQMVKVDHNVINALRNKFATEEINIENIGPKFSNFKLITIED